MTILQQASELVAQYGDLSVRDLMEILKLSEEKAKEILKDLDNGSDPEYKFRN